MDVQVSNNSTEPIDLNVAFSIFNWPDTTQQVFDAIRRAKPKRLLTFADGPRPDRPRDRELCKASRDIGLGHPEVTYTLAVTADANRPAGQMSFQLHHPPFIIRDCESGTATYVISSAASINSLEGYYGALAQVGVLNSKDMDLSGEERFLGNTVANWQTPFILDAGAKDGHYSSAVLKACPSARLAAFESDPVAFEKLSANFNGAPVSLHNFDFSDKDNR